MPLNLSQRRAVALGLAGIVAASLAGCNSVASGSGPVTIKFAGWASGYKDSVALWNKSHPNIKVEWSQVPAGTQGGYQQMLTAVKAGKAPCLGQVGYETIPSFATTGALMDVTTYTKNLAASYVPFAWSQVTVAGKVVGVPVDTGPMGMFYRKDLLAKYGVKPPTTWAEFRAAAEKVHAADPSVYLTYLGNDAYSWAGLAWQAGAPWFGTSGDKWSVSIDNPATQKVAEFWQGLVDDHLVKVAPSYDAQLYSDLSKGKVLSDVNAVWDSALIEQGAGGTSGKWAVAPMPVWDAANPVVGNAGGSATVVLAKCAHPQQAVEFANWMSSDSKSMSGLIKTNGLYPAARTALDLPVLSEPNKFFGGQKIYDVFKKQSPRVSTDWAWGPAMPDTASAISDALGKSASGTKLPDDLAAVQASTVKTMSNQGFKVSK